MYHFGLQHGILLKNTRHGSCGKGAEHMFISIHHAQEIVMEIGNIVGQNINLMDENGIIIASTDPGRIGAKHSGASRILSGKLDELYISAEQADATTRPGLNLAVKDGGETVGVVGISGDYDSVYAYGRIVKKMTEILIRERSEEDSRLADRRIYHRFLEEWVLEGSFRRGGQEFVERGRSLGIDITLPRRVLVLSLPLVHDLPDPIQEQKLAVQLEQFITMSKQALTFRTVGRQVVLLRARCEKEMLQFAAKLQAAARQAFDASVYVGCDGGARDIHAAYLQAERAWQAARIKPGGIALYRELTLELFLDEVTPASRQEYLRKLFPEQSSDEMDAWMTLLDAYFAADGSILHAAELLYIHKNTLQYRLHRLQELTGHDLRRPADAAIFYLARAFYAQKQNDDS